MEQYGLQRWTSEADIITYQGGGQRQNSLYNSVGQFSLQGLTVWFIHSSDRVPEADGSGAVWPNVRNVPGLLR